MLSKSVDALAVHYSSMLAEQRADHAGCDDVVRNIQRFHQDTRGWNDIAYSWLFCNHGHAYEGRGWAVMTAATAGHNSHTQAICFLGTDRKSRDDVTVPGREAAAHLVQEFLRKFGKDCRVGGHRDWVSTSCPGDELYAWVVAKGWLVDKPDERPWPIPVPPWFWVWARWQRERFLYATRAKWMHARPVNAPKRVPDWAWVRLAAMTPRPGL
jgi:hypothetical protein